MTSLSQNEINSLLNSYISRICNSKTYLNKISSNLYSQNDSENWELHKLHSFPLIIKENKYIIDWNEEEKGKYLNLNGFFDKIGPHPIKNNEIIYKFFKFILNKNIYKLKIKVNKKMKINSICLIYTNPKTSSNKTKIILINNKSISTKDSSDISISKNEANHNNKNIYIDFAYSQKNYCNYFPKGNEMRINAEKIPTHFPIECYHGVNQIHNNIGKKEFLELKDNNIFCMNNDSYKSIDKKEHLFLNHLYQKNVNKRIISSFTFKYRLKNSTFIYYK